MNDASANVPAAAAGPPSILILDDEELVVLALRETLSLGGYSIQTFTESEQALVALGRQNFAVILSDQRMPAMTGLQFLARARALQPNASRILMTGVLSLDTVIESINKGEIYRFIVKPWFREELLATIHNAVQRYELLCRNEELHARTQAMNRELLAQVAHIGEQNERLVRLNDALEENLQRSIELCLHMLEAFLPALGSQAHRVRHICRAMAEVLQLPADEVRALEVAAWLHDIGLIGVPRSVVRRWRSQPAGLTEVEWALIHQHPVLGETLARFAQPLENVGAAIRSHHERFDGRGYPDALQGEAIPWFGRLLAVAVCYAGADDKPATVEAIKVQAGSVFDPEAVRVFLRALPRAAVPHKEHEVLLSELQPGMLLARGIYTANGMLLVPEGQRLTATCIEKVINHNRVNPINQSLLVYC